MCARVRSDYVGLLPDCHHQALAAAVGEEDSAAGSAMVLSAALRRRLVRRLLCHSPAVLWSVLTQGIREQDTDTQQVGRRAER